MHLLFSMTLAGSMIFLIYLIIRPAAIRYFPTVWRYGFSKVILLIILLPYQYFKYTYIEILEALFAGWSQSADAPYITIHPDKTIFSDSEGALHFENRSVRRFPPPEKSMHTRLLYFIHQLSCISYTAYTGHYFLRQFGSKLKFTYKFISPLASFREKDILLVRKLDFPTFILKAKKMICMLAELIPEWPAGGGVCALRAGRIHAADSRFHESMGRGI